jgi:hypothetical protein
MKWNEIKFVILKPITINLVWWGVRSEFWFGVSTVTVNNTRFLSVWKSERTRDQCDFTFWMRMKNLQKYFEPFFCTTKSQLHNICCLFLWILLAMNWYSLSFLLCFCSMGSHMCFHFWNWDLARFSFLRFKSIHFQLYYFVLFCILTPSCLFKFFVVWLFFYSKWLMIVRRVNLIDLACNNDLSKSVFKWNCIFNGTVFQTLYCLLW